MLIWYSSNDLIHSFTKSERIKILKKKLQISLFIISLILSIAAFNVLLTCMPKNSFNIKDIPIFLYVMCILITGILILFPKLNYLMMLISIALLIITIATWIKFPEISIIYTPFIAYLVLCLLVGYYSIKRS